MTWIGENTASGLLFYTTDGSPGVIEPGITTQILQMVSGVPSWQNSNVVFDANEGGVGITDVIHKYEVNSTLTTSSSTFQTVTPTVSLTGSGNFYTIFSAAVSASSQTPDITIAIFVNDIESSGTRRRTSVAGADRETMIIANGVLIVPLSGVVQVKWRRDGGNPSHTLSMNERSLTMMRAKEVVNG